jgi:uncharacterized protein
LTVEVRVIPHAKKREAEYDGQQLRVRLTAPPRDGRANEELVDYLAGLFSLRRSEIRIIRGEKDRRKVVFLPMDEQTFSTFFKKRQELQ